MKKSNHSKKHILQRRPFAFIMISIGLGLILASTVISFIFISPTDFKSQYRERQLIDCLAIDTEPKTCQSKFGD